MLRVGRLDRQEVLRVQGRTSPLHFSLNIGAFGRISKSAVAQVATGDAALVTSHSNKLVLL